jgi:4-phytase/acid phosphatase
MTSLKPRATLFTSLLLVLLSWTLRAGARGESEAKPVPAGSTAPVTERADIVSATATPTCSPSDKSLKFAVALFRHGVRAPLKDLGATHSQNPWPSPATKWGADDWGYLTRHGCEAVKVLGAYYGSYYSKTAWCNGFKVYLWADVDERTVATAQALRVGMKNAGVDVKLESLCPQKVDPCVQKFDPCVGKTDPLFHPFKATCGTPDPNELKRIATNINDHLPGWLHEFTYPTGNHQLGDVYLILGCNKSKTDGCQQPLNQITDHATAWSPPTATPTPRPSSPIQWNGKFSASPTPISTDGQFPYASTATEAFLLEYVNGMPMEEVGWGNELTGSTDKLGKLLALHEFYFNQTEREPYLAGIAGANLVREIFDQLTQAAGKPRRECMRASGNRQFVGLVGHDTNLANVQTLLNVKWSFNKDQQSPVDLRALPDNDALPAGALVFELRQTGQSDYTVRIQYITQSLNQIRGASYQGKPCDAEECKFHYVPTTCADDDGKDVTPCEMRLKTFEDRVTSIVGKYGDFLSRCKDGQPTCSPK